jgi:kinesin family protein 23
LCDKKVQDKQKEMEEQVLVRSEKLNQLRNVLENLQIPAENQRRLTQIIDEGKHGKENKCCCGENVNKASNVESKCEYCDRNSPVSSVVRPKKTPKAHLSTRNRAESTQSPRTTKSKIRSKSPPATPSSRRRDIAPVRGKHRRSRSTDFYLNHKPAETLETDTLMKPMIKNKKTVTQPSVKDLKVTPGYVLTHQEEDSSGEICTQLIRGDVLSTRGDGISVQFTDVEKLSNKHESVIRENHVASKTAKFEKKASKALINNKESRKRLSDSESSDSQQSYTDVEDRCNYGIGSKNGAAPAIVHHKKTKV